MPEAIQNLARFSPARAEAFLGDLANLPDDQSALESFMSRYADLLERVENSRKPFESLLSDLAQTANVPEDKLAKLMGENLVRNMRKWVRALWAAPDYRTRLWFFFRCYQDITQGTDHSLVLAHDPPPSTIFEQYLLYLLRQADRARHCANQDCPAPYFFARRRGQKYCTPDCTVPAQREWKKRWWKKHGSEWLSKRKKRPSEKTRTRRGSKKPSTQRR